MLDALIDLNRQGRHAEAEEACRLHLATRPDDSGALHLLATLLERRGERAEAIGLLERAHALAPEDSQIELTRATYLFRAGDLEQSRQRYEHALALNPNLHGAHSGLGHIALREGDSARAEQHFRISLRAGEEPHALGGLGTIALERGNHQEAVRHLQRATALEPGDPYLQYLLGRALAVAGTLAFAEQALRNALALDPALHAARWSLISMLLNAARADDAEAELRVLDGQPGWAVRARIGMGDVARLRDDPEAAVARYREALQLEPGNADALRILGATLMQLGRAGEALEIHDQAVAVQPGDRGAAAARADLLMAGGDLMGAARAWRALLDNDPQDLTAHIRLALLGERLGEFEGATGFARRVLGVRPQDAEMRLVLLRSALRGGDAAAAREQLALLGQGPLSRGQGQLLHQYRGFLLDQEGDYAGAVEAFARAQAELPVGFHGLRDVPPELASVLDEPPGEPWPHAPVLLVGAPGSGVEEVAALLADQPGLFVLRDRVLGPYVRDDEFQQPQFDLYTGELDGDRREQIRQAWLAPLEAIGIGGRTVVDWLPRWDARLLAMLRRVMPGTRILHVVRESRSQFLHWLAFGWLHDFPCVDIENAAGWLRGADRHLHHAETLPEPRRLIVNADIFLHNPTGLGTEVAAFLGIPGIETGPNLAEHHQRMLGLPTRFAPDHWQRYEEALAGPFGRLTG